MLHAKSCLAYGIQPIFVTTQIITYRRIRTQVAVFLCSKHIQFFLHHIERECAGIRCMYAAVLATFLSRNQDNTVGTPCTINSRSRAVFQYIETGNVIWIKICKITSRHTVNYNQRAQTCRTRRNATYLNTGLVVGVARTGIGNRHSGHFALNHHGRVNTAHGKKIFLRNVRNG